MVAGRKAQVAVKWGTPYNPPARVWAEYISSQAGPGEFLLKPGEFLLRPGEFLLRPGEFLSPPPHLHLVRRWARARGGARLRLPFCNWCPLR
eukprot:1182856-Prorocentrum_minimum.AAC.1